MKKNLLFAGLLSLFFSFSNAQTSDKEGQARAWIKENIKELNLNSDSNLSLRFVRKSLSGETLRFQQMINGVPVFDTELVIHFSPNGDISYSDLNFDKNVAQISTVPQITKEDAIAISDKKIDVAGMVTFQENKLFVYNKLGSTKLVYRIVTSFEERPGSWEVILDANSGEVLSVKDIAIHCGFNGEETSNHGVKFEKSNSQKFFMPVEEKSALAFESGSAMVFLADPLSSAHATYGDTGFTDGNGQGDTDTAQLNGQRVNVTLPQVENTAGTYKLKSSYVEIKNLENPNKGLFTQATSNFAFTRSQDGFEAANVFYHTDNSLRYINQTLGIPCVQNVDNSHAGVLWFDPSGENGADNSHYSNGVLVFGEGCVDDGEDGDVIWHELGHGLHDWLTGGSLSQVNGLSEGSGDYWAQSHSRILNHWTTSDAAYHYMFNWDGHNTCWGGRTTNYGAVYPGGLVNQVHTDGQIWSTVLMKIWDVIGREKTDKAFLEGLSMTNSSTNQQNAAIAVRQAAIDMNFPCADVLTMTQKFTQAGYTMPAVTTRINCPGNQTVVAGAGNTYSMASFISQTNVISANCSATATQNPAVGTSLAPGTYTVTMTATGGTSCNFQLTVQPALSVDEFVKKNLKLYPNPASTEITVSGDFISGQDIEIYNLLGQKLIQKNLITNEEKIDISSLSSGVYTAKFKGSNTTLKFIKN
ncbi:T9SS type A sorting domain-containing protein [Flavobacterium terrae]|uniref:Por secretion system C-terminal sorting domain-containing protein n=1 Tax=Flavobacterium terrae TaxID=415425 RepID=A0A1M6BRB4_9FLAO|nr:T9SS type A sorting domain-containing protein [Flavobacterium terrae]SHI51330.1 Por secretion system C-terminal sorting domain-containing protein [Flavobacterium terrae]